MKNFKIYGASDDIIDTSGLASCDEFNIIPHGVYVAKFLLHSFSGKLYIHALYDGCWSFAISAIEDDCCKLPDWEMISTFGVDTRYSWTVEIKCPDDTVLVQIFPNKEE